MPKPFNTGTASHSHTSIRWYFHFPFQFKFLFRVHSSSSLVDNVLFVQSDELTRKCSHRNMKHPVSWKLRVIYRVSLVYCQESKLFYEGEFFFFFNHITESYNNSVSPIEHRTYWPLRWKRTTKVFCRLYHKVYNLFIYSQICSNEGQFYIRQCLT